MHAYLIFIYIVAIILFNCLPAIGSSGDAPVEGCKGLPAPKLLPRMCFDSIQPLCYLDSSSTVAFPSGLIVLDFKAQ